VYKGGLRVHSTLDLPLQEYGEALLRQAIAQYGKDRHFTQGAIVCIDPHTGAIRALVGGRDWQQSKFNRATQALRQPGSSFKPFLYLTAFSQGYTPAYIMNDTPVTYIGGDGKPWTPKNYDLEHYGDIPLRKALEVSNNVIAVKLINKVGVENVIETAHRLGLESTLAPNMSLALGTSEVTPLDMCAAYGVFATYGLRTEPIAYTAVEDRAGTILEQSVPRLRQVYPSDPIKVLDDVMQGVILRGTGYEARILGRPAAGKTGTTSDHRDAWFVGFTPNLVTAVWLGNDDNTPMAGGTTGGDVCAPLWAKFMIRALQGVPVTPFAAPPERLLEPASGQGRPGSLATDSASISITVSASSSQRPRPRRKRRTPAPSPSSSPGAAKTRQAPP
ncbi:MAG: penicillin-binding protein, partial [Cyanobacteria bacterium REEB65]|nr:penicillin-binding protein [Cyanobacteria bacterium REEB65]